MIVLAALGAGLGCGAWLVLRSLMPRPARLDDMVAQLSRPARPASQTEVPPRAWSDRAGSLAARLLARSNPDSPGGAQDQMLRLAERSAERHALDRLLGAAGGFGGTVLVGAGLSLSGVAPPTAVLAVAALAAGFGGFLLPAALLAEEAERRRRAFRHALSAYLDLVNVILAGGGGIETALHAAADAGDGWAFAAIRQALDRARLTNRTPWDTLAQLGGELGVDELAELAANVALAGSQGARIRQSLAAKADSLRGHQVAETEAAAEAATERMTIPVAVLLFGFLIFVAYPAIQQISTVTTTPLP